MRRGAAAACTALVLVAVTAACARERVARGPEPAPDEVAPATTRGVPGRPQPPPAAFPIGTYTRTIAAPPPEHAPLEGRWALLLNPDGTFELAGRFATRGRYTVDGATVTFEHDEACPEGGRGVYRWSADGTQLRFQVVDDACGATRQYHLASGAWTRS